MAVDPPRCHSLPPTIRKPLMRPTAILAAWLLAVLPLSASADPYRIGVSDVLQLRVLEWQPIDQQVRDWPAMAGEYVVSADGTISVPFLGPVTAEGRLAEEIGDEIGNGLKQRFALPEAPDAAVEILSYRPLVVAGLVRSPGEYAFRPGLTAQHAIGIAGGLAEILIGGGSGRRELISGEGALQILMDRQRRLTARQARLEAERDALDEIPAATEEAAIDPGLLADEKAIMQVRRDRQARELQAIEGQKELLSAEVTALEAKEQSLERQRELAVEEQNNAKRLADRGLVANSRLFEVERMLASVESQLLDVSTAMLRARQGIAAAERDRVTLIDSRSAEILQQLQDIEGELAGIARQIQTEAALTMTGTGTESRDPIITVLRQVDGAIQELPDAMQTLLQPGDMIEVTLPATDLTDTSVN